ncbi:hypothetical protein [Streptosporangium roseum]|uniref:hypothetical protein n=1 Tax=Streptosporangium roseum TaxID=2001 RepID=UPI0033184A30
MSPLQTSAAFLLCVPAVFASSPLAGRLIPRLGIQHVPAIGPAAAAAGLLLLSLLDAPYAGLLVFPFGAGVTFSAATLAAMQDVRDDQTGLAGGVRGPLSLWGISGCAVPAHGPHMAAHTLAHTGTRAYARTEALAYGACGAYGPAPASYGSVRVRTGPYGGCTGRLRTDANGVLTQGSEVIDPRAYPGSR